RDGPDLTAGLVAGAASVDLGCLGSCNNGALQVALVHQVDHAPVGEVPHHEVRDPRQCRPRVQGRGQLLAGTTDEIEARLPLGYFLGRGALRDLETPALVLGTARLTEVAQDVLRLQRLVDRIADRPPRDA